MMLRIAFALAVVLGGAGSSSAHESRPAYLQIREGEAGRYDVLWKVPTSGEFALDLTVIWPAQCRDLVPAMAESVPGALIERSSIECGGPGLVGSRTSIAGLAGTLTDALVRVEFLDGRVQTSIVKPAEAWVDIRGPRPVLAVASEYVVMGAEHILGGIDHLMFVLGLMLLVSRLGPLVKTITAFTVAHSFTLGLATLGYVHVPQAPVEAAIALSIVILACELVRRNRGVTGLSAASPWLMAFGFGLLHGLGFAGALAEVGLPEGDIPLALVAFNLGVEAGQIAFVTAVLSVVAVVRRVLARSFWWAPNAAAYGIGSVASFWLVERVVAFS